ncbi:hypothetical protein [Allohahella marinimesophila]|uniref:Aminomethyltransferase folate-binding domain-containing protein n=1 Tax=Allohahella marinimesophila TaxID=1054972 RepID=A0ABP7Q501_9GAMM
MYLSSVNTSTAVRLTGVDSSKFLQGQLTCDVSRLEDGQWTWAAVCSPKGRVIDVFKLFRQQAENYLLLCWSEEASQRLLTHLSKYKVFFKCEFTAEKELPCVGVLSSQRDIRAALDLSKAWQVLGAHNQVLQDVKQGGRRALAQSISSEQLHWAELLICGEANVPSTDTRAPATLEALRKRCSSRKEIDYLWQAGMLALGIPRLDAEHSEVFTAHALGLHTLGAISFSKGCFTGQEIVARTQYLGNAKKYPIGLAVVEARFRNTAESDINRLFTEPAQLDTFLAEKAAKVIECCDLPSDSDSTAAPPADAGVHALFSPFQRICLAILDPEKI